VSHRTILRNSNLGGFQESDRINTLDLPGEDPLPAIATAIESAMKAEQIAVVRRACTEFLNAASEFYVVPECSVRGTMLGLIYCRRWNRKACQLPRRCRSGSNLGRKMGK
jgi:hypothetical protein